jgi:ADP-heptose:LPS heptosyltransferase
LGSTSKEASGVSQEPCEELLALCLAGKAWTQELLDQALGIDDGRVFLSVVVERLGDLFEPRLCGVYESLFAQAMERALPALTPRIRRTPHETPKAPEAVERVYVLSRITLGADVAVTSVLLDAAKRRYPRAEIVFVGPNKSFELFADERLHHFQAPYARSGSLAERLQASASLWIERGIVIDPDSRISQLGLLSICPEEHYFHFPSRSYGGETLARLPELAAQWAQEVFGVKSAQPYIAPAPSAEEPADITVSLGVGVNPAKRGDDEFERDLLQLLAATGASLLVDKGGSAEEAARVEKALPAGARTHQGDFAPFAAQIARSKLYVGYDSAGGHVASASGVPVISIAKGFVSERMAARWRPVGAVVDGNDPQALRSIQDILAGSWPSVARS